jgi:hypothetical protein
MTTITSEMINEWFIKNNIDELDLAFNIFTSAKWPNGKTNETVGRWITRDGTILRKADDPRIGEACLVNVDAWNQCLGTNSRETIIKKDALSAFFFSAVSNMRVQAKIAHLVKIGFMTRCSPAYMLAYYGHLAWCLANPDAVADDAVCKMLTELSGESAVMPDGSFPVKYKEAYLSVYRGESRPSGMNYDLEAVETYLAATE